MRSTRSRALAFSLFLAILPPLAAQAAPTGASQAREAVKALAKAVSSITEKATGEARAPKLSLITILPGKALYSSFGHTAIRVVDDARGYDRMYNFGLSAKPFDLAFALNMLRGHMDFMVGALRGDDCVAFYSEEENRTIIEQDLDLGPAGTQELIATLEREARPENRVYNYRYFTDNCATRPAVILRQAAGDDSPPFAAEGAKTLRSSVDEVLGNRAWLRLAIDTMLGPATDKPMPEGPIFLPGDLMKWAARASIATESGPRKLVPETRVLYQAKPKEKSPIAFPPLAAALFVLALTVLASIFQKRGPRLIHGLDLAFFILVLVPWIAVLVFRLSAGYAEVGGNLNLLWASPLPLIALILARKDTHRPFALVLFAVSALAATALAALGGLGVQVVPAEARLIAAALALRCAFREGLLDPSRLLRKKP
jgi:hypothetical protein